MKKIQISFLDNIHKTVGRSRAQFAKLASYPLMLALLLGGGAALSVSSVAQAAACPRSANNLGTAKVTLNIPADDDYAIWTRMAVPDSDHNYVGLDIDGKTCYLVGGHAATSPHNWRWVNMGTNNLKDVVPIKEKLTKGSHTFKYIGTVPGVILDRIIATPDGCVPEDKGDNCPAGDAKGPTVEITSPASGKSGSGTVKITATAADSNGIKEVQFLIDGTVRSVDSTSPYTFDWNSGSSINGTHKIQAKAVDKAGNSSLSSEVSFKVTGGGKFKKGDITQDGTVNVKDLSSVLRNWGKDTPDPSSADTNGDHKVDIKDLLSVVSDWSK